MAAFFELSQQPATKGIELRYQPLISVAAFALGGIALDRVWPWEIAAWLGLGLFGLIGWWLCFRRNQETAAAYGVLLAVASLGGAWHHAWWHYYPADDLGRAADEAGGPLYLEAVATSGTRPSPAPPRDPLRAIQENDSTYLYVRILAVRNGRAWQPASGATRLHVEGHLLGVEAGDRLRIVGRMFAPGPQLNPGQWDGATFYRGDRQRFLLAAGFPNSVRVVEKGKEWSIERSLASLRTHFHDVLWSRLSYSRAGLATALLLGAREQLDEQRTGAFFSTGTIHILAISGMHIALLAWVFFAAARSGFWPRRTMLLLIASMAVIYTLITDAEPPVMRAAILVVLLCGAAWIGARTLGWNALAAGALVVVFLNPTDLFRSGTQLSFVAAAVLMWLAPHLGDASQPSPLEKLLDTARPWYVRWVRTLAWWHWQILVTSVAVWLVTLPLVVYHFHLVSPLAIPLNALLAIPSLFAMLMGFLVMLLAWLLPPLAFVFAWVCDLSLYVMEGLVSAAAELRGVSWYLPDIPLWWVLGVYLGLGVWLALGSARPPLRWSAGIASAWLAIGILPGLVAPYFEREERPLAATFLAVGHGTCVLLELPDGRNMLYDCGQLGFPQRGSRLVASALWQRGITHLDAVVLSHADIDHYNALPGLLERVSVGAVYVSPVMFEKPGSALRELRDRLDDAGMPLRTIKGGDRLSAGKGTTIEVLHPPRKGVVGSDNANSIVLAIGCGGRRLLLPGDLESPGIDDLMAEEPLDCDIVMAPHHGSARSNPRGFAAWSRPEFVVVSGSRGQDAREVRAAYEAVGAEVCHTAERGAVRFEMSAAGISVRRWLGEGW